MEDAATNLDQKIEEIGVKIQKAEEEATSDLKILKANLLVGPVRSLEARQWVAQQSILLSCFAATR